MELMKKRLANLLSVKSLTTLTLTAVHDAAGSGPSGTAQAACSSTAQVFVQP